MVKSFFPDMLERELRDQATHLTYLLGDSGYKAYRKLAEEASPYAPAPDIKD